MKSLKGLTLACAILLLTVTGCYTKSNHTNTESATMPTEVASGTTSTTQQLWYEQPAAGWVEALPVGNGRLGAMVFGGTDKERIQFNEDTLWTGRPRDYSHPGAAKHLATIRKLIAEGEQQRAEDLAQKEFMGIPLRQFAYQPFGDLRLSFPGHESVTEYQRDLDLNRAVATTRYTVNGVKYTREVFSSYVDQVLVVNISADKKGALNFTALMDSPHQDYNLQAVAGDTISLTGKVKDHVLTFEAQLKAMTSEGIITAGNSGISVKNATSVTLVLAAATSFKDFQDVSGDPQQLSGEAIAAVSGKSYQSLLGRHIEDHQRLYQRMTLDLGTSDEAHKDTLTRIKSFQESYDPALVTLLFNYGRYLLIASSRAGSQPANLQGIWNEALNPPWSSKWTTNINAEMNYWPAEVTNLSETHQPLFDMIKEVAQSGSKTAKIHYDADGWVLHHNTDIWRGTAPINNSNHGIWVTGGAWLTYHLWEHYLFTGDKQFLRDEAYPLLKGSAEFFVDFLVEDPKTGWLISTPSNSPEHGGLVAGPTMDHQIIRALFSNTIKASEILGQDEAFRETLQSRVKRIAPNQVGKYGQLQEWLEDIDNPDKKHRHVSHLWGLHPGAEISALKTPKLAKASAVTLKHRGDDGTGWSLGWKLNLWARLFDGDHAYKMLKQQLRFIPTSAPKKGSGDKSRGGSYTNLFDAHPPFQIDGNLGVTAGIAEMLLQSHEQSLHLLPALASAWPKGEITGLRARGGIEVDIQWQKSRLVQAKLLSDSTQTIAVRYSDKVINVDLKAGQETWVGLNHFQ
jgi:alpha-L-fucosidase 2